MIKLSYAIPEIIPDITDTFAMREFLTNLKLCVQEIATKAKSIQTEVRAVAPTLITEFEVEGEDVRCSADSKTYTLFNGAVKSHLEA